MQIKTIWKVIRTKLDTWLETIENEELVKDLRKNILVSWGSITSMLLNEDVNDYDIYINDMDVLKRVAEYYAKPFDIEIFDWRDKAEYESRDGYCGNLGIDAEGWVNQFTVMIDNLKEDQIKLDAGNWFAANEDYDIQEWDYVPVFFSPNAISLSNDIQIVCRFHWDNVAIHRTFDFIHATNYFTFESGLVTNKAALESIITKQLKYQWSLYPLTSIIRMKKFIKRGWNISAWEMLKCMFQLSLLDLKNPNVLEDQLIGVDVAYFGMLIEILRGNPEKTLCAEYLNEIIDRVFNSDEDISL